MHIVRAGRSVIDAAWGYGNVRERFRIGATRQLGRISGLCGSFE